MHFDHKLALVIPSLHEAQNLRQLLPRVCAVLQSCGVAYEILVVDDDSRDGTEAVVNEAAAKNLPVRLLVRHRERGLSGAILHGWQYTDAAILGVMDADLQHPPELLPKLLAEIRKGSDVVLGSRYARNGGIDSWNPFRRLLSALAVWATLPVQRGGLRVKDPMSGYFLVQRRCVERVTFQQTGFKLLLEVLVRGHVYSVSEVPFIFGRRRAGTSKVSLRVAWEYLRLLIRLYTVRWTRRRIVEVASGD